MTWRARTRRRFCRHRHADTVRISGVAPSWRYLHCPRCDLDWRETVRVF